MPSEFSLRLIFFDQPKLRPPSVPTDKAKSHQAPQATVGLARKMITECICGYVEYDLYQCSLVKMHSHLASKTYIIKVLLDFILLSLISLPLLLSQVGVTHNSVSVTRSVHLVALIWSRIQNAKIYIIKNGIVILLNYSIALTYMYLVCDYHLWPP